MLGLLAEALRFRSNADGETVSLVKRFAMNLLNYRCALFGLTLLAVLAVVVSSGYPQTPDNKSGYNLFNPAPADQLREMSLDGPGATESPYTVDAGHFQVEMTLYNQSSYEEDFDGVTYSSKWWGMGPINLKLGLLNNLDMQLILEPYNHAVESEVGDYRIEQSGVGDASLRFKLNLWGNDGGWTALAVLPYVKFPTSDTGLGNEHFEGGVVLPFSLELPGEFYLGLTSKIGAVKADDEASYHTEYENSISLSRALFGDLEGYVEFFSAVTMQQDSHWIGTFGTGLAYWLTGDLQMNTSVAVGANRWSPDWHFGVGMGWRY